MQGGHRSLDLQPHAGVSGRGAKRREQHLGRRRRWAGRGRAGGEDLEPVPAGPPERVGRAAGEIAQVAAAQQRHRAVEMPREGAQGVGGGRIEPDGVGIRADLGKRAVEVEKERVIGPKP